MPYRDYIVCLEVRLLDDSGEFTEIISMITIILWLFYRGKAYCNLKCACFASLIDS